MPRSPCDPGPAGHGPRQRRHSLPISGESVHAHSGSKGSLPLHPADAAGLLRTAIRDDNPVCFFEHKVLYATKGEVPDDPDFCIPFGKADIKREGTDVTIVANLLYVKRALEAADELAKEGISALIANTITGVSSSPAVVMFIINIILLILGMVMEPGAILTLMLPVLLPIADTMGYNLVYFGVVVVLNLMIGQVTPPFGVCLFVISDVNKIKLERIYKSILPFLVPLLITLAVTCIFPQVVTFLPDMLLGATAA